MAWNMLIRPGRIAPSNAESGAYPKLRPQNSTPHAAPSAAPTAMSCGFQRNREPAWPPAAGLDGESDVDGLTD